MTQISGILTDYARIEEGEFTGHYGARIDDTPYVVMHHVDAHLLRLSKSEHVEVTLNIKGHISKIVRAKGAPEAKKDDARTKEQIAQDQAEYNAKADEEVEKRKAAGFGEPSQTPAARYESEHSDDLMAAPVQVLDPVPPDRATFNAEQIALIRAKCAPNCTATEFQLLLYMADKYKLDPLVRQIWAVKYKDAPAAIFCGRDGFLEIAHRSGVFDGMESGTRIDGDEVVGWCTVYRKDMSHPFKIEVYLKEYQKPVPFSGKPGLWQTMPRIMLQKVAESSCLRRAFSVSGLYCPEEMPEPAGV
jgi:phage recombination protein Bet